MERVIIESPYRADTPEGIARNVEYARRCVKDSVLRGEAPIASHLLFTQEGILDDKIPEERELGIAAGLAWAHVADKIVAYVDLGISGGMRRAIESACREFFNVELRSLKYPGLNTSIIGMNDLNEFMVWNSKVLGL